MANLLNDIISVITSPREAIEATKFRRTFENVVAKGQNIKKAQRALAKISSKFEGLKQSDIKKWRNAHALALNTENPIRSELYSIYRDALLNDHLKAVIKVRLEKLLKRDFKIVDEDTEEEHPELTKLFHNSWFWQYMTLAWEANLYGFSLIQFGDLTPSIKKGIDHEFCDVEIIPRPHVKPEFGIIVKEPFDEKGVDYRKGPLAIWTLEIGNKNDLGLLLEATPLAISNKYMGIFWDEFAEMFAAPIRIGKTNTENEVERSKVSDMLEKMGRMAYAVVGHDTEIQIVENQKKDAYMVYDKRMERNNKGMSKLVLGSTMTVEDGSSLSQSQVHQAVTEDIADADARSMLFTNNEKLFPFLINHGYPLVGKKFKWDDTEKLNLKEQSAIDKWLIDYFDIEVEYFRKKYNASIVDFKPKAADGGAPVGK